MVQATDVSSTLLYTQHKLPACATGFESVKDIDDYNSDVIVSYYISIAPFPLQFSIDMLSNREGETRVDKHYNWNVGRVTGLSEKYHSWRYE